MTKEDTGALKFTDGSSLDIAVPGMAHIDTHLRHCYIILDQQYKNIYCGSTKAYLCSIPRKFQFFVKIIMISIAPGVNFPFTFIFVAGQKCEPGYFWKDGICTSNVNTNLIK